MAAVFQPPDPVADYRHRLRQAGFSPLPLNGKRPFLEKWQKLADATPEEIALWSRVRPAETNTGILTACVPALDIDVLDPEAATAIEEVVRERFEERGYVLVRFGRLPKRAIPFRTDQPFPKIAVDLIAPDGQPGQKVEFLGDGQQIVVDGVHPDTGKPYAWHGGQLGDIKREGLPYIHPAEAQALVEDAVAILVERFGYTRARERPKKDKPNGAGNGADHDAADWQYLFDNIRNGDALHDSLRDLAAKLIASGMSPGAAINHLRGLMEGSSAPRDDRWKARFAEIPRLVAGAEKFREPDQAEAAKRRPQAEVPLPDGELLPVMRLLDQHLTTEEAEPPMRSLTGWPVEVRASEPVGMHELTAAGANAEEEPDARLPPPRIYTLAPHTQCSMALAIENYVGFVKRSRGKNGEVTEDPKRLPGVFVTHYMQYGQSRLPRVATLATMPLVLPNGKLLATNGLDHGRQTVFRVEPEIAALMPGGRVIDAEVTAAIKLLTDVWLVDVQANYEDKCVLLALALTTIERGLLGERPAFFITAGKRGGGKTTAVNMVSLAVLGKRAPAAAWSQSDEERRKAIFAALMQCVPFIVFDNIRDGSTVACPIVEKMLTSCEMEDRVLGTSRYERVACSAIPAFTGNNILAKGALASRALMARINVDRPDPENRAFTHPDPFSWTLDHRRQIISALYAVLIGNPRLREKPRDEKTRFKPWQRLVGSAIEYAASLAGKSVDFAKLFQRTEEQDEEAASLAETLQHLDGLSEGRPFKAAQALTWASAETDAGPALKSFFGGSASRPLSANGITRKLKANTDAPVMVGSAVWTLRAATLSHTGVAQFGIDKRD
jgi:Bifunctional DNA primase/polymerase, N-terminal